MEMDGWGRSQSVLSVFFSAGTPRAAVECSLCYNAETLMLLYGFTARSRALSEVREDYAEAFCEPRNAEALRVAGECGISLLKDGKPGRQWK